MQMMALDRGPKSLPSLGTGEFDGLRIASLAMEVDSRT